VSPIRPHETHPGQGPAWGRQARWVIPGLLFAGLLGWFHYGKTIHSNHPEECLFGPPELVYGGLPTDEDRTRIEDLIRLLGPPRARRSGERVGSTQYVWVTLTRKRFSWRSLSGRTLSGVSRHKGYFYSVTAVKGRVAHSTLGAVLDLEGEASNRARVQAVLRAWRKADAQRDVTHQRRGYEAPDSPRGRREPQPPLGADFERVLRAGSLRAPRSYDPPGYTPP
jgi:hypothetical protein